MTQFNVKKQNIAMLDEMKIDNCQLPISVSFPIIRTVHN